MLLQGWRRWVQGERRVEWRRARRPISEWQHEGQSDQVEGVRGHELVGQHDLNFRVLSRHYLGWCLERLRWLLVRLCRCPCLFLLAAAAITPHATLLLLFVFFVFVSAYFAHLPFIFVFIAAVAFLGVGATTIIVTTLIVVVVAVAVVLIVVTVLSLPLFVHCVFVRNPVAVFDLEPTPQLLSVHLFRVAVPVHYAPVRLLVPRH
mmetsp:Transcript_37162/g.75388  ORF Transcript_37162/g.75388 Transcript_37162/m.75388 type:complete len:205 (-) Transcript_37162:742-1356(-)